MRHIPVSGNVLECNHRIIHKHQHHGHTEASWSAGSGWNQPARDHRNWRHAWQTLFPWLFLSPLIAIGLALIKALITTAFGRTEPSVSAGAGTPFTGAGALGLTTRFKATDIMDASIERERRRPSNSGTPSS
jgi:hypothetical protein